MNIIAYFIIELCFSQIICLLVEAETGFEIAQTLFHFTECKIQVRYFVATDLIRLNELPHPCNQRVISRQFFVHRENSVTLAKAGVNFQRYFEVFQSLSPRLFPLAQQEIGKIEMRDMGTRL